MIVRPMNTRMLSQELIDAFGLVGGELVGDDVDLLAGGLMGHDVGQEGDKLRRAMARRCLAQHPASLDAVTENR